MLPGAAAGGSSYQLYQPSAAGSVIQFVDAVTGAAMSLPAQHHAVTGFTPSSIAATHTPLSSLAPANHLELPVSHLLASDESFTSHLLIDG